MALVEAFEKTKEPYLLEAAKSAARCLARGQLHSGGWQQKIEFDPKLRERIAYRVDVPRAKKAKNMSSLDDDQTQCAIRFLAKYDRATQFHDAEIHETVVFAINSLLKNQFPNGAWAQGFEVFPQGNYPVVKASYPTDWSRTAAAGEYWIYYTLNDNALVRTIETLWLAFDIYGEDRYREAAIQGAEFLRLAQMPDPQPAWAQQSNYLMEPVWARKFEPPAISGRESQDAIECLMTTFVRTGNAKYLQGLDRAIDYLEKSVLPDGQLARFYELRT